MRSFLNETASCQPTFCQWANLSPKQPISKYQPPEAKKTHSDEELSKTFWSTGFPLARTRWVYSTISSHCPIPTKQHCWLTSATLIIYLCKYFGNAGNQAGDWMRSKYDTTVLASPFIIRNFSVQFYFIPGSSFWTRWCSVGSFSLWTPPVIRSKPWSEKIVHRWNGAFFIIFSRPCRAEQSEAAAWLL